MAGHVRDTQSPLACLPCLGRGRGTSASASYPATRDLSKSAQGRARAVEGLAPHQGSDLAGVETRTASSFLLDHCPTFGPASTSLGPRRVDSRSAGLSACPNPVGFREGLDMKAVTS